MNDVRQFSGDDSLEDHGEALKPTIMQPPLATGEIDPAHIPAPRPFDQRSPRKRLADALLILTVGLALIVGAFIWSRSATSMTPVSVASDQEVLFVGDGWFIKPASESGDMTAPTLPALVSQEFGWTQHTDAVVHAGYLDSGLPGTQLFENRLNEMSGSPDVTLIVIQGSVIDASLDRSSYSTAVSATWRVAQKKFPNAAVAVLGPAPTTLPATAELADTDRKLAAAAETAGLAYLSPLNEGWVKASNIDAIFSDADLNRLSPSGAEQIAIRLQAGLSAVAR